MTDQGIQKHLGIVLSHPVDAQKGRHRLLDKDQLTLGGQLLLRTL